MENTLIEPPPSSATLLGWAEMTPAQRNDRVGKLIGAEPLGQYYLYLDGRESCGLPCTRDEKEKAEGLVAYIRGKGWTKFASEHGFPDAWRKSAEARLVEWHIRHSDTPGGGWEVVQAIRTAGYAVSVESMADGDWFIQARQSPRVFQAAAPTMAEAACLIALKMPWPNRNYAAL